MLAVFIKIIRKNIGNNYRCSRKYDRNSPITLINKEKQHSIGTHQIGNNEPDITYHRKVFTFIFQVINHQHHKCVTDPTRKSKMGMSMQEKFLLKRKFHTDFQP